MAKARANAKAKAEAEADKARARTRAKEEEEEREKNGRGDNDHYRGEREIPLKPASSRALYAASPYAPKSSSSTPQNPPPPRRGLLRTISQRINGAIGRADDEEDVDFVDDDGIGGGGGGGGEGDSGGSNVSAALQVRMDALRMLEAASETGSRRGGGRVSTSSASRSTTTSLSGGPIGMDVRDAKREYEDLLGDPYPILLGGTADNGNSNGGGNASDEGTPVTAAPNAVPDERFSIEGRTSYNEADDISNHDSDVDDTDDDEETFRSVPIGYGRGGSSTRRGIAEEEHAMNNEEEDYANGRNNDGHDDVLIKEDLPNYDDDYDDAAAKAKLWSSRYSVNHTLMAITGGKNQTDIMREMDSQHDAGGKRSATGMFRASPPGMGNQGRGRTNDGGNVWWLR